MLNMSAQQNKFRQAANIFLTLALVCAAAGVFIYFLTTPEDRDAAFWMSMGLLLFAGVLSALFASRIVYSGAGRQPPHTFVQLALAFLYAAFVIGASIANAFFLKMSAVNYFLLHAGGGAVFLLPLQFVNMAGMKSAAEKEAADGARGNLRGMAFRVQTLLSRAGGGLSPADAVAEKLRKLADNLLYSEPSTGPDAVERALALAVGDLEARGELLIADPENAQARAALSDAADAAVMALKARNEAILRAK